jgi:glycosyltransferase involved in cell wall biosynthesis
MKIIISTFDSLGNTTYGGGGALAVHEVAKRLAKNHEVAVLAGNFQGAKNEIVDGVTYRRVGWVSFSPKLDQLIFSFCLPYYVKRLVFDAWLESFTPPFSTAFLPLFTSRPVVGLTHLLSGKDMRKKYGLPFDWVEKFGFKFYQNIITLQDFMKEYILKANPKCQVEVIPNGVDSSLLHLPKLAKKPYILFLGRIDFEQKGLDLLLEAYSKFRAKAAYKLYIAGRGLPSDEAKLQDWIRRLELEHDVELLGRVDGQEKWEQMQEATVMVLPSRIEYFSLVVLEAFAAQTPLINFDIQGTRWAGEGTCVRIPEFDTNAFAQGLQDLVENPQMAEEITEKAHKLLQEYDWDSLATKYENLLSGVVK